MSGVLTKLNEKLMSDKELRKRIRLEADCTSKPYPLELVDGDSPPRTVGCSYGFTNKRGDKIYHPNAYMRAWGKPIYHPSSLRVEIGADWLLDLMMGLSK